jgi:hypothetical protein
MRGRGTRDRSSLTIQVECKTDNGPVLSENCHEAVIFSSGANRDSEAPLRENSPQIGSIEWAGGPAATRSLPADSRSRTPIMRLIWSAVWLPALISKVRRWRYSIEKSRFE